MRKDNPLHRVHELIRSEEERTNQEARRARISPDVAISLMTMEVQDWYDASGGTVDFSECARLVKNFESRGIAAANGLRTAIPPFGVVLEVAKDSSAPPVEITHGIPHDVD